MLKKISLILISLMLLISFSACSDKNSNNVKYISGTYMNDELDVGYEFFSDGKGYQFILEYPYLIKYKIIDNYITITTLSEKSRTIKAFTFEQKDGSIIIDGVIYVIVQDTVSEDLN